MGRSGNFCQKKEGGGGKVKQGEECLEKRDCNIILKLFWGFLIMQHRKRNLDVFIFILLTNMCYKVIASGTKMRRDIKILYLLTSIWKSLIEYVTTIDVIQTCRICIFICKTNFTDHDIPNTINHFSDSVLVCKLHDCQDKQKL